MLHSKETKTGKSDRSLKRYDGYNSKKTSRESTVVSNHTITPTNSCDISVEELDDVEYSMAAKLAAETAAIEAEKVYISTGRALSQWEEIVII